MFNKLQITLVTKEKMLPIANMAVSNNRGMSKVVKIGILLRTEKE
jgi:hypothetical protein